MFLSEYKRLLSNKLVIISFILMMILICVNIMQIQNTNSVQSYYKEYEVYKDKYKSNYDIYQETSVTKTNSPEFLFHLNTYANYKEDIKKNIFESKEKLGVSIFADANNQKVLKKEIQSLQNRSNISSKMTPSLKTNQILQTIIPYFSTAIFTLILVYFLFYQDIHLNLIPLYKSNKQSLGKLYITKTIVLLSSISLFIITYMSIQAIYILFDIGNLNTPIQMIYEFNQFPFLWSVLQFILFQMLFKILVFSLVALIFICLLHIFKNIIYTFGCFLVFLLLELLFFLFTPINSFIGIMKFINIYYMMFYGFDEYNYRVFMGVTINTYTLLLVILFLLFLIMIVVCDIMYQKAITKRKSLPTLNLQCHSIRYFIHQFFQLYIMKAGIIIMLLVLGYGIYKYSSFSTVKSAEEQALFIYKQEYLGKISDDKLKEITILVDEKQKNYDKLLTILEQIDGEVDQKQLDTLKQKSEGLFQLQQVKQEMENIISFGGDEYVEKSGYTLLFSEDNSFSLIINFMLISVPLCILTSILIATDYRTKMNELFEATKNGKYKAFINNQVLLLISNIGLIGIVLVPFILKVKKAYLLFDYNYALNNIANTGSTLPLYAYYIGYILLFILICYCISMLTYYISMKVDTLIAIPIMLCSCTLLGILFMQDPRLSPLLLISINALNYPILSLLYIVGIIGVCILLNIKIIKRK